MNKTLAISLSSLGVAAILGGSAVGATYIMSGSHATAAASPAPTASAPAHHKHHHHEADRKIVVVPAPAQAQPAAPAHSSDLREVSPGVYAGSATSDAFAENVVASYPSGPGTAYVYSPVTGQSYEMTYTIQGAGTVIATGGNGAYVQF